jgi:SNF2 family DNA or RNA helicase
MLIIHSVIVPPNDGATGLRLGLWAESPEATALPKPRRGKRALRAAGPTAAPHPFTVPVNTIRAACAALTDTDFPALPKGQTESIALRLPTASGALLPSPELARIQFSEERKPEALGAWRVEALTFEPLEAMQFFAALPAALESPTIMLSTDTRFWSLVAKFALELLARQRYLPTLVENDGYTARWAPALDDPRDQQRFGLLARAMPASARAAGDAETTARAVLLAFLGETLDAAVRNWAGIALRGSQTANVETRWLAALFAPDATISARAADLAAFRETLDTWQRQLRIAGDAAYRVCFRLEPPELQDPDALMPRKRVIARDWMLSFHLQPSDDLSLLVSAAEVWAERGSTLRYLKRRFEQAHERLLAALGYAARIFPPLERALRERAPVDCLLTAAEAYQFLREAAVLLENSGFGVLVPPWWNSRKAGLALRARVKGTKQSNAQVAKGMLGFDTLVQFQWEVSLGGETISREEFQRLAALKMPLVQVRGQWVELRPDEIDAAMSFWQAQGEKATLRDALRLSLDAEGEKEGLPIEAVAAEGWVQELLDQLRGEASLATLPQPGAFVGQLRPYQAKGFSWLTWMKRWGLGACLADDMGLGKTIQLIAMLLHERESAAGPRPSLLICPTSVVGNWLREVERFAPNLRVIVHHGIARRRGEEFAREASANDLVISSYGLILRDEEALSQVEWDNVVLDEAQNIKNPSAKQTQAARRIPANYHIALTGTPVENRLSELWSIMQFLNPGYLGGQTDFRNRFAKPIERYQDSQATARLQALVKPFILRRLKTDPRVIQDLPDKLEMKVFCNLTKEQATLYEAVVRDTMSQIEASEGMQRRGLVLAMLAKLKQVCNHPAHFLGDGSVLPGRSGKLARLGEMLEEVIAEGDRALVFTQFTEMGELLKAHLQSLFGGEVLFLHGGTPQKQRDKLVARFQQETGGPHIFILSLKAGGTGLNLTRANHVFHYDRWWNPAVENQATDRAFRIGQRRNVQVHKYVCIGTMEEKIDALIESKKALAENVVGTGEAWLTELNSDALRDVFTLRQEALAE